MKLQNKLTHAQFHDYPHTVPIKKIVQETPQVKRYTLPISMGARPGQFINLWIPGVAERPMSVAFDDGKELTLAIASVGKMTGALDHLKAGDFVGIRGPYGTHFTWKPRTHIAMLAGGYGTGPLYFCASLAVKDGCTVDLYVGARSAEHLLFIKDIKKLKNVRLFISTDDGSLGFHGFNVAAWKAEMDGGVKYDQVMTVGPELMMKAVAEEAHRRKIPAQISVERFMKCGFGICGNCCVDDAGITTCVEGPVMDLKIVRTLKEFGVYHRDDLGKKHNF